MAEPVGRLNGNPKRRGLLIARVLDIILALALAFVFAGLVAVLADISIPASLSPRGVPRWIPIACCLLSAAAAIACRLHRSRAASILAAFYGVSAAGFARSPLVAAGFDPPRIDALLVPLAVLAAWAGLSHGFRGLALAAMLTPAALVGVVLVVLLMPGVPLAGAAAYAATTAAVLFTVGIARRPTWA